MRPPERVRCLLRLVGRLLAAGLLYTLLCMLAGRPLIPCLFHRVTGLYCPGCGVSRMCLALLRLDFAAAWRANPVLLMLLPVGMVLAVRIAGQYIKTGNALPTALQERVLIGMVILLVLFGILRNLPGLEILQPH